MSRSTKGLSNTLVMTWIAGDVYKISKAIYLYNKIKKTF